MAVAYLMMEKGVNTPYTSSAGRLFDAVSSLLGVCDTSTHQAEAPVKLEQLASDEHQSRYSVLIERSLSPCVPYWKEYWKIWQPEFR